MERIVIDYDKFLFKHFAKAILQFVRNNFNIEVATQGITWIEHDDNTAYYSDDAERDFASELVDERKRLFFPFTLPNFGEPIPCADGEEYILEDYFFNEEFEMDNTNILGFLLEVNHEKLIINSAKYSEANAFKGETIHLQDNCSVFDEPMTEFIFQFLTR